MNDKQNLEDVSDLNLKSIAQPVQEKPNQEKPKKIKKPEPEVDFRVSVKNGKEYITFKANTRLKICIYQALKTVVGSQATNVQKETFPVVYLANYHDLIVEYFNDNNYSPAGIKGFKEYSKIIEKHTTQLREEFELRIKNNRIEFNDVKKFLKEGDQIVLEGTPKIGGIVKSVKFAPGGFFRPNSWNVKLNVIHNLSGDVKEDLYNHSVYEWQGTQSLASLNFKFKKDVDVKELEKRGVTFAKFCNHPSYVKYSGNITNSTWRGTDTFRADGRLMIDPKSMLTLHADKHNEEMFAHGFTNNVYEEREEGKKSTEQFVLNVDDYWRIYPYSLGFSFRCKKWGSLQLDNISEIEWRSNAFESLVLPNSDKRIVKALVENAGDSFTDIIDEKGGGTIFLLFGPPGEGKTLTAETIAELLKKPLYSVTVGELGTKPSELESNLRVILELATSWDAVLLLDEADIFLEARDTKDIVRNAMVGVFLRLLEYHQGTLFLTTNRVKNIDTAFYSRISIPLKFPAGDSSKRYKIWTNLFKAAGIDQNFTHDEIYNLSLKNTNGRQIKNAIRIGQTLARSENTAISVKHIEEILELADNFEKSLKLS